MGEKWEKNCVETIYKKHEARWIESYRKLSSINSRQIYLSRCYQELSTAKRPRWIELLLSIYRVDRKFLDGSRICQEAIETNSQKLRWIVIVLSFVKKGRSKVSIDSLGVESCREAVKMSKNSFSKKRKTQKWMQSSKLLNQRSKQHFKLSKISLNKKKISSI